VDFSKQYYLSSDGDSLDVEFTPNKIPNGASEFVIVADSNNSSKISIISIVDDYLIKIYNSVGDNVFTSSNALKINKSCKISVVSDIQVNVGSIESNLKISINDGVEEIVSLNGYNFSVNTLGGNEVIGTNISAYVEYIKINGDEFQFNEGSGKYVTKQ